MFAALATALLVNLAALACVLAGACALIASASP